MISNEQLKNIEGGGISIGTGLFFGGVITFIIGLVDGYVRPLACR